jgi:hypothetical protein
VYHDGYVPYWHSHLRGSRLAEQGMVLPVLYHPKIVKQMLVKIRCHLQGQIPEGVLVTGPQGIGKSCSLINTVIQLESTGNYLVTFLPDWRKTFNVVKAIADSIGIRDTTLIPEMNSDWSRCTAENNFEKLVDAITNCLAQ